MSSVFDDFLVIEMLQSICHGTNDVMSTYTSNLVFLQIVSVHVEVPVSKMVKVRSTGRTFSSQGERTDILRMYVVWTAICKYIAH